jgi:hypothetical protein
MAFVRWADLPAGTTHFVGPHRPGQSLDAVPEVWLRDLAQGTERRLPGWKPESDDGAIHTDRMRLPVTWTDEHTILLDDGSLVDIATGAARTTALTIPRSARPESIAWSPDGRRAVCIADGRVRGDRYGSVEATVFVLEPGREPKPLTLGSGRTGQQLAWDDGGMHLGSGVFEWTPDGARLRFCLVFHESGSANVWERTGLLDLDGTAHVVATSTDTPGFGGATWSAGGSRGAFVLDRGGWTSPMVVYTADGATGSTEVGRRAPPSDLFVTDADGSDVARVTDDGAPKSKPFIDPAGRRVAFLTGAADARGRVPKPVVRILDLASGRTHDLDLATPDDPPTTLAWMPGGDRLLYASSGVICLHAVDRARTPADGRGLRRIQYSWQDLLRDSLESGSDTEVAWAAHLLGQAWDAALVPAVRAALRSRVETDAFDWVGGADLLTLLSDRDAREALPEVRLAARPGSRLAWRAVPILAAWMGREALPELDAVRTRADGGERIVAAAAMVGLGDDRGWATLRTAFEGPHPPIMIVASMRDPRVVDLLIARLADAEPVRFAAWDAVGDQAEHALAQLTGRTFARDKERWIRWWEGDAKRVLPDVPRDNPAVRELDRASEARRKAFTGAR